MATKKQKREAAAAKRAQFEAEVKASGLAAQKADKDAQEAKELRMAAAANVVNQRHRSTLLSNGINPSTGEPFTDAELEGIKRRANTPERKALYDKIVAGRAALLEEQSSTGMSDADDPFGGMTVGDFRDKMNKFYAAMGWDL